MTHQIKTIKVSDITHSHLKRLGRKGQSFESIIVGLIQEHIAPYMADDIKNIHKLTEGELVLQKSYVIGEDSPVRVMSNQDIERRIREVFSVINYDYGIYDDSNLQPVIEGAMDEDMVGSAVAFGDRDLPLAEVISNVYCMLLEMPSPTTTGGQMITPFHD